MGQAGDEGEMTLNAVRDWCDVARVNLPLRTL